MIRNLIDDQMVALKPIVKDMDVKEDLIKNMSKYLHQGYEIFKNPKFEAGSEAIKENFSFPTITLCIYRPIAIYTV